MSTDFPPSRQPKADPWARYVAVVTGLALLAAAVVCGRELWLRNSDSITWDSWVDPLVMTVGNATYQTWMLPAGVGALILGLVLLWIAVRPRTRTHQRIHADAAVWMRPVDIARMLTAATRSVPGVASAHSRVTRKSTSVSFTAHPGRADGEALAGEIERTLAPQLDRLGLSPTLRIRQRTVEEVSR